MARPNELLRDVCFLDANSSANCDLKFRLVASNCGVCVASSGSRETQYIDCAYVPAGDWRNLSESEIRILTAAPSDLAGLNECSSVVILKAPKKVLEEFSELHVVQQRWNTVYALRRFAGIDQMEGVAKQLTEYFLQFMHSNE